MCLRTPLKMTASRRAKKPSSPKRRAIKTKRKASPKGKQAQSHDSGASSKQEQSKNASPSLAQSLNPKRDFALRSKKPAEPKAEQAQKASSKVRSQEPRKQARASRARQKAKPEPSAKSQPKKRFCAALKEASRAKS